MTLKELAKFDALRIEMDELDKRRLRQIEELRSDRARLEGEHERLKIAAALEARLRIEDAFAHINTQVQLMAANDKLNALVSSLTRLQGGYLKHKAGCEISWCEAGFRPPAWPTSRQPVCTCDLGTLLATLTRLTRSPEASACAICGKPATCRGAYEGEQEPQLACDSCCGHGNEDGRCEPLREMQHAPNANCQATGWHLCGLARSPEEK
jgi:hypothetical protein